MSIINKKEYIIQMKCYNTSFLIGIPRHNPNKRCVDYRKNIILIISKIQLFNYGKRYTVRK